jgi:hypothetical protein
MGKNKAKRRPAMEVIKDFTREDIAATMEELTTLSIKLQAVNAAINAMRDAKMDEAHITNVRETVGDGVFQRRSYLEAKIRRVALALLRAKGHRAWEVFINENISMIPTASEKQQVTLSTM